MITTEIIKDSVNSHNSRVTTYLLTYPRFIHAELMTHRVFSRNAASSRAIPVKKMIEAVKKNPAMPEYWGSKQKGMQAGEQLTGWKLKLCKFFWLRGRDTAVIAAKTMLACGLHKQIANRVLEPWMHITVLVTATHYNNFFALRAHKDAQPEFQVLAYKMLDEYLKSKPQELEWGEWHIPFSDDKTGDKSALVNSVASAARTSYTKQSDDFTPTAQLALYNRMSEYGHWSPFEHQAKATIPSSLSVMRNGNLHINWVQYRTTFSNQNKTKVDLEAIQADRPEWTM